MDPNARYTEYPKESPWKRGRDEIVERCSVRIRKNRIAEAFDDLKYVNMDIDIDTKRAALKVSASVVNLVSMIGRKVIFMASGTIIGSDKEFNGKYSNTIITSASLLTSSTNDIRVEVCLSDGRKFDGHASACDLHYNLAIINIKSDSPLPVAMLRLLDSSMSINPRESNPADSDSDSDSFNLCPGEMVVAIGRLRKNAVLMVAPGYFSIDCLKFDCKELMRASCQITKCGIGGPLVNCYGEVIGVNFCDKLCTPFLPINIVSKWLEHFKKHGKFYQPWIGMEVADLYTANVDTLQTVIRSFPNIFRGVVVEKVIPGSPAECAGIRRNDVIVQCGGNVVSGFLELCEKIWDKAGESLEMVVRRKGCNAFLNLRMVVEETCPIMNSWPLPQEKYEWGRKYRRST